LIAPLVSSYLSLKSTDLVVNVKEVNHITTEQRDDSPHINIYRSLFSLSDCLRNEPELYVSTTGFKMSWQCFGGNQFQSKKYRVRSS
jgi:hypothetical protein